MTHPDWQPKLLESTARAMEATSDMIAAVQSGKLNDFWNTDTREMAECLATSLRLLLEACGTDDDAQLLGALVKYLDERG